MIVLEMDQRDLDKILVPYSNTNGTGIYEDFTYINGDVGKVSVHHMSLEEAGSRMIIYSLEPYFYSMTITEIDYDNNGNGAGKRLYINGNGLTLYKQIETMEFDRGEALVAIRKSIPETVAGERLIMVTCNGNLIGKVGCVKDLYSLLLNVGMATKNMMGFLANINIVGITMAENHAIYESLTSKAKEYEGKW